MNEFENNNQQSEFSFEPYSLLRDVIRNLWVVVLAALIGLMGVRIWSESIYTPMYTSTATLLVNLKNSASYSYTNLASSSEMAQIFTGVFVQPTMKKNAATYLGVDGFVGDITSSVLTDTNIFTVSVTSPSPETSYTELCAILEVYPAISESVFSDSVIEIMRSPNLPASPSNSLTEQYKTITVLGCAGIVLAIIVFLSLMRDTVKDERSFRRQIDARLFGTVLHERSHKTFREVLQRKKTSLLISNGYASFGFTENYHKIATKLEYMHRHENAKIFLLTSIGENEGKSTTAANIALALANRGGRVALLDMDFKKPAIHKIFEVRQTGTPDFASLLEGKVSLNDLAFYSYKNTGLDLALNLKSHSDYVNWIYSENVTNIFERLRRSNEYDYIIIDTPPLSVAADVSALLRLADKSLLVVRTDCVYAADINDTVLALTEANDNFAGCILNDIHREFSFLGQLGLDESGYHGYYGYYHHSSKNK